MLRISIIITLTLLSTLFACKDTNSAESQEGAGLSIDSLAQAEGPDVAPVTIYTWVSRLRLREKPKTKSKVLAELKEGTALSYLQEKTDYKEKINLRGELYHEPWLKVRTEQGQEGWVYGGAVRFNERAPISISTPYEQCLSYYFSNFKRYASCVKTVQKKQLKKDQQYVRQDKEKISIRLLSGKEKILSSNAQAGPGEAATYDYRYYIPQMGYFVVEASGHEWGEYLLINDKSGKAIRIWGYPKAAPDFKRLLVTNADLEAGFQVNGIQLLGFTEEGFQVLWEKELEEYEPQEAHWVDNDLAEIRLSPSIHEEVLKAKTVQLKQLPGGDWVLVEKVEGRGD